MDTPAIDRGDVYRISFRGTGSEPIGAHYAIVVSDVLLNRLSRVIVVPPSSSAEPAGFRPQVVIGGRRTRALLEQVTAIDKRRLGDRIDSLAGTAAMNLVDEQLRAVLGLDQGDPP